MCVRESTGYRAERLEAMLCGGEHVKSPARPSELHKTSAKQRIRKLLPSSIARFSRFLLRAADPHATISYAQEGEDIILLRLFGNERQGSMLMSARIIRTGFRIQARCISAAGAGSISMRILLRLTPSDARGRATSILRSACWNRRDNQRCMYFRIRL